MLSGEHRESWDTGRKMLQALWLEIGLVAVVLIDETHDDFRVDRVLSHLSLSKDLSSLNV